MRRARGLREALTSLRGHVSERKQRRARCPTFDFSGTVTDEVEEKVWWQTDGLDGLETVWIKTDADVVSVELAGALCFDEAGDARVMFRVGKEFHYPPNS